MGFVHYLQRGNTCLSTPCLNDCIRATMATRWLRLLVADEHAEFDDPPKLGAEPFACAPGPPNKPKDGQGAALCNSGATATPL